MSAVLGMFWNTPAGVGLTASELVGMTGLTRATILSICDELREQGWVTEDRAPSAIPGRGRQARRFTFNQRRYLIAAADVGFHSVTSAISDLKGTILGQAQVSLVDHQWQADRTQHLLDTFEQALREANVEHNEIEMGCIGVAAPVTYEGEPYPGQPFWELMRIDQERLRSFAPRWRIIIENDANLAALAEQEVRVGKLRSPMVTLLAGERLGAGVIVNGELLKGFHGGAGEMGHLEYFQKTEGSLGFVGSARRLVHEALRKNHNSLLREIPDEDLEHLALEDIFDAADSGDILARDVLTKISDHIALAISTATYLIDPSLVIIAGGAAAQVAPLLPRLEAKLSELTPLPPAIETSTLGRDVVLLGAIHNAIRQVRAATLTRHLHTPTTISA